MIYAAQSRFRTVAAIRLDCAHCSCDTIHRLAFCLPFAKSSSVIHLPESDLAASLSQPLAIVHGDTGSPTTLLLSSLETLSAFPFEFRCVCWLLGFYSQSRAVNAVFCALSESIATHAQLVFVFHPPLVSKIGLDFTQIAATFRYSENGDSILCGA